MKSNLKKLREKAELSQPQLAQLSGVSQQSISKIESEQKGYSPRHETLVSLGNALGVTVEELTGVK